MNDFDPTGLIIPVMWLLVLLLKPVARQVNGGSRQPGWGLEVTGVCLMILAQLLPLFASFTGPVQLALRVPLWLAVLALFGRGLRLDRVAELKDLWSRGKLREQDVDPTPLRFATLALAAVAALMGVAKLSTGEHTLLVPAILFGIGALICGTFWYFQAVDRRMVDSWFHEGDASTTA